MKILVLNSGSSSIKCALFDFSRTLKQRIEPIWQAHLQWRNVFEKPTLKIMNRDEPVVQKSVEDALKHLMDCLKRTVPLREIRVIGHRIVHGGQFYKKSVRITEKVKTHIRELSELAPLHNLADLIGIEVLEKLFQSTPQIAVFDTAFHHTLSKSASVYPGPYRWVDEGIVRYGFHGISFQYCTRRAKEMLPSRKSKLVICHLGSGASLCAVQSGKSVDTTMGFTPLEGLMMDTRSGTIDPGIILHLLKKKSREEMTKELYKESGLLGLSGISSDMRDILAQLKNPRAKLTLDVYLHKLNGMIGAMIASLQGVDALIFTAGIGENAPLIREKVCRTFGFLGIKIDPKKNKKLHKHDCDLATPSSKARILLIHTKEAFEIANECWRLIKT